MWQFLLPPILVEATKRCNDSVIPHGCARFRSHHAYLVQVIENQKTRAQNFDDETDMVDAFVACGGRMDKTGHVKRSVDTFTVVADGDVLIEVSNQEAKGNHFGFNDSGTVLAKASPNTFMRRVVRNSHEKSRQKRSCCGFVLFILVSSSLLGNRIFSSQVSEWIIILFTFSFSSRVASPAIGFSVLTSREHTFAAF